MSRIDRIALLLALFTVLATALVADRVFERLPHLEDEMAYTWEARAITGGQIKLPTPVCPRCFLQPFVVDYNGARFGKYPLGWPVVLAAGELLGARSLVNPLLAGFTIWLIYLLGKKLFDPPTGLLAAFLTATSPFFLMNSASLLSHPWSLLLSVVLTLAWLDTFAGKAAPGLPRWLPPAVAAGCIGLLVLTRPLTAVGVTLPFFAHGLYLLVRGTSRQRSTVLAVGAAAAAITVLHFAWQVSLTGDVHINPYTLWWPYDRIGFGPDVGLQPGGYNLQYARANARFSLWVGSVDLFGWFTFSWLFLPFGLIAIRKNRPAWLAVSVLPTLLTAYLFYWIGSWLFGPRYYYEGLFSLSLLSAAGIRWLAGTRPARWGWLPRLRLTGTALVVAVLISINLFIYMPQRLGDMRGLYNIQRSSLALFESTAAQSLTPALVIVHPQSDWVEYGRLLDLSSPYLNTPFVFTISRGEELNAAVIRQFPDRRVYHYYPATPDVFYTQPQSGLSPWR